MVHMKGFSKLEYMIACGARLLRKSEKNAGELYRGEAQETTEVVSEGGIEH